MKENFNLEAELLNLPENPGVYIMHNADDEIIYVGKAKNLKNRVRQYFTENKSHTPKVRAMVANVEYFEYIITDTETEALVLECNLIKKHRPKYNILLKDDKHYPYIKITIGEDYPRIMLARKLENDGSKYFGPYSSGATVKNTMEIVRKLFLPPTCKRSFPDSIGKGRPCLNYQINACFAPCRGKVTQVEFKRVFEDIAAFLDGDHKVLVSDLKQRMREASQNLEYERAAQLRDKIIAIQRLDESQKINNTDNQTDMDLIAVFIEGQNAFVEVFFVRGGIINGRESYRMEGAGDREQGEVLAEYIKQFYSGTNYIPPEILTLSEVEDHKTITEWLRQLAGKSVKINVPQRGEKKQLMSMIEKNARRAAESFKIASLKRETTNLLLTRTKIMLGLDKEPERIEAYDISNISGSENVGSMVVFKGGKPARSLYRSFNIKSFEGADDYRAMQEVLYRRFRHAAEEEEELSKNPDFKPKFLPYPDMIFIDGGAGHLAAACEILDSMEIEIPTFGMVKDSRHRTRGLISRKGEISISPTDSVFKMITRIQDEAHNSAITHHRNRHRKAQLTSELDNISGVGPKRRSMLLKTFGSVDVIRQKTAAEMTEAGIDRKTAAEVYKYFHDTERNGRSVQADREE